MARISKMLVVLAATLTVALAGADRSAQAAEPAAESRGALEVRLIEDAIATVAAMKKTSAPGFERLWRRTKAVLVVPNLARGGWIIGGEFGSGLLLVRRADAAEWSDPVFFTLASGSVGFQFGADLSQLMLVVTADTALDKLLTGRVRLGADVGFAAGPIGRGTQLGRVVDGERADIFALSIARGGLYGGVAVKGGVLLPNNVSNARFYGADVPPARIVARPPGLNDGTLRLRAALSGFLEGLVSEPLRTARSEAAGSGTRRNQDDTAAAALAAAGKPGTPESAEPVKVIRLFDSASVSVEDLEDTRRTRVEAPPLSVREGQIVDSLRRNDIP